MTLVERFIEINDWSTSRKTALVAIVTLPAHIIACLIGRVALVHSRIVDMSLLDGVYIYGTTVLVLFFFIGLVAARFGKEARWTAYFMVVFYSVYLVAAAQVLGTWTSSFIMILPVAVMLASIVFGKTIGWFAFFFPLILMAGVESFEAGGMLPYAPALLDRSIDAQQAALGIRGIGAQAMLAYLFAFTLSYLAVEARKLQETRLREARQQLQRSNKLISRYVPAQVAHQVMSGAEETLTQHERRKLTIFFSDLVGFTDISEELEPEDLSRLLNEYFSKMTDIAQKHGGTVDELSGDAILVFFGAPQATNDQDHALRAVRMAQEMQEAMPGLNARWRSAGITESLQVRMGINTGVVTVGNFGSQDRMKYAALGKHVNLAARLQANCEPGKVLLSHSTWLLVNDQIPCTQKGEMTLKGISKPVMAYEPTGAA